MDDHNNPEDQDYDVGYQKPPKHTQFKLGQSGNPSGKKKGKSLAQYIADAGDEIKTFLRDGQPIEMTLKQAVAERLLIDAAKGKHMATKIAMDAEQRAIADTPLTGSVLVGSEELEVAQTHMDWLKLIEGNKGEKSDADGSE